MLVNSGTLKQVRTVNNANVSFHTLSTDKYRGWTLNNNAVTLTLWALDSELNGISNANLALFRWVTSE